MFSFRSNKSECMIECDPSKKNHIEDISGLSDANKCSCHKNVQYSSLIYTIKK